jgi:DNA polymerase
VRGGDLEFLEMLFGNVPDTLSQLIRTAFVAPKGRRFIVADFSAIEARIISWLAGEKWRIAVFNTHGKIYEASAAQMFKVPIESITKGSDLRQRGKVSELALGYNGGPNALIAMGALAMGVPEDELPKLVNMWRKVTFSAFQPFGP